MTNSNSFGKVCADLLERIHDQSPLIHHITNLVVMNDTANLTIALGASPVMAHAKEEVAEMVSAAGALVLPGAVGTPFAGWSKAKAALDKAITEARAKSPATAGATAAPLVPWSVHDLRRTVATGLQRLGVRLEVTEAVLNHISGSRGGIAGVYQRHDWASEKRAALDAWAAHVLAIVEGRAAADNVVKLSRAI